jgi:hypothetical protein
MNPLTDLLYFLFLCVLACGAAWLALTGGLRESEVML